MTKLTKTFIEQAEVREKAYFLFDSQVTGLCVRISPTGKRHYYLQYMVNKRVKRTALGQHGIVTLDKARDKATSLLAKIKDGLDPQEEKRQQARQITIEQLAERYLEYIPSHCKQSTVKEYKHYLNLYIIPSLGNITINKILRADIASLHYSLRYIPYSANRCLAVLSSMFSLSEVWGLRDNGSNPCKNIKKYAEHKRERFLTKEEAKRLGQVLYEMKQDGKENVSAIHCIELLLYTGCRLNEIKTLKWGYVDYDNSCLRLPDSKTGARVVHVGVNVVTLLKEIEAHPLRPSGNPYVIWGSKPLSYLVNIRKPWRRITKKINLEGLRIHDLRHSFASFAVNQGLSLPVIGKLLGHRKVQTTARYAHLMNDTIREAASSVSSQIAALIEY